MIPSLMSKRIDSRRFKSKLFFPARAIAEVNSAPDWKIQKQLTNRRIVNVPLGKKGLEHQRPTVW